MLIAEHISAVLLVTGVVTALPILLFLFPVAGLKLLFETRIDDAGGRLFAQHRGLMAFSIAALLIYAAEHSELRAPIMLAALTEKAGLVAAVAANWSRPHVRGLRGAAHCSMAHV